MVALAMSGIAEKMEAKATGAGVLQLTAAERASQDAATSALGSTRFTIVHLLVFLRTELACPLF